MEIIGLNCSDCSHFLLSDFCLAFAVKFLMKIGLFSGIVFSSNCGLERDKGNWGAIDVLDLNLLQVGGCVNCEAINDENCEGDNCDAINLFFKCEILLLEIGVSGANGLFIFVMTGKFLLYYVV